MKQIEINGEYIKLGQALKLAEIVTSGVEAKFLIVEEQVKVNGIIDTRRGRKLYKGDKVEIEGHESFEVV